MKFLEFLKLEFLKLELLKLEFLEVRLPRNLLPGLSNFRSLELEFLAVRLPGEQRFLALIVKPSSCHCADGHSTRRSFRRGSKDVVECRPPSGALPPSPRAVRKLAIVAHLVCTYMCVYIYIYVYICTERDIYTYISTYTYTHTCIQTHIRIPTHIHTYTHQYAAIAKYILRRA